MARQPVRITDHSTRTAKVTNAPPSTSDFGLVVRSIGGAAGGGSTAVRVTNTTAQRVPVTALVTNPSTTVRVTNSTSQRVPVTALVTNETTAVRVTNSTAQRVPVTSTGAMRVSNTSTQRVPVTSTGIRVTNTSTQRIPTSTAMRVTNSTAQRVPVTALLTNESTTVRVTNSTSQRVPVTVVGTVAVSSGNIAFSDPARATRIDEASTSLTYIGSANPGTVDAATSWQIKRINSANPTAITFADGNANFDNQWTNRGSLSYS